VLVDNEAAFLGVGDYGLLLEPDGEHCTPEGYRLIAQTFLAAIQATMEQAPSAALIDRRARIH
jgi:hypothetical protein